MSNEKHEDRQPSRHQEAVSKLRTIINDLVAGQSGSYPLDAWYYLEVIERSYEFLDPVFLQAMNDIGQLGVTRYAERSFHAKRTQGDRRRDARLTSCVIADHARAHFEEYLSLHAHDHFGTEIHQLAAAAFNAMMEAFLAGLTTAPRAPKPAGL